MIVKLDSKRARLFMHLPKWFGYMEAVSVGDDMYSYCRIGLVRRGWFNRHVTAFKGATAYELQVGRLCGRICHLKGEHWAWKPWRRFNISWLPK